MKKESKLVVRIAEKSKTAGRKEAKKRGTTLSALVRGYILDLTRPAG